MGLEGVTGCYKGYGVKKSTGEDRGLQGLTGDYKGVTGT